MDTQHDIQDGLLVTTTPARLVATFPLSGCTDEGYQVFLVNEGDQQSFAVLDLPFRAPVKFRSTMAGAVDQCLQNAGWGD